MKQFILLIFIAILSTNCKNDTALEDANWIHLFDGTSTEGWRAYNGDSLPQQWIIKDGTLTFDTKKRLESEKKGGVTTLFMQKKSLMILNFI